MLRKAPPPALLGCGAHTSPHAPPATLSRVLGAVLDTPPTCRLVVPLLAVVVAGALAVRILWTDAALLADAGLKGDGRDTRRKQHVLQSHHHGKPQDEGLVPQDTSTTRQLHKSERFRTRRLADG